MPASYRELLSRVDLMLGEPHPAAPTGPVRWEVFRNTAQLIFNAALNSSPSWAIASFDLTVTEDEDTYTINAADFGKDLLVETINPTDTDHVSRPVGRASLSSLELTNFPSYGNWTVTSNLSVIHSARGMAFYREAGVLKVRVLPIPQSTAQYRIWYEVADTNLDAEGNSMFTAAGESYLVSLCALTLLPYCKWSGNDNAANSIQKKEIASILTPIVASHEKEWRRYISSDRQAGKVTLGGFDDEEYSYDYS